eukprot:TRINITY_DN112750_c0_g1_i1.p3 TRINITY_DN112750_c0_g1~~TRINITY_DN112750_c0_g1_i1.p3  ORF type:complete len:101 (+),score=42.70 TRINITY_DN112750_c0_g1_i1:488-790(+)
MCEELGPGNAYMHNYVEEQGGTSLCNVLKTDSGCSDKQKKFIDKWNGKPLEELQKQEERLAGMIDKDAESMKADVLSWAKQRMGIFKQLVKHASPANAEL